MAWEGWKVRGILASRESSMDSHFHSLPQSLGTLSSSLFFQKIKNMVCSQLKPPFHKLTVAGVLLLKCCYSLKESVLASGARMGVV